jgi:hypothetical protein
MGGCDTLPPGDYPLECAPARAASYTVTIHLRFGCAPVAPGASTLSVLVPAPRLIS